VPFDGKSSRDFSKAVNLRTSLSNFNWLRAPFGDCAIGFATKAKRHSILRTRVRRP
jgi:hypothetical protein